jgi:DNA-binding beta-propeller fold protein YncE
MPFIRLLALSLAVATFACGFLTKSSGAARAQEASSELHIMSRNRQLGPIRAPELNGGLGWLNTDRPLSLAALKGKVVLLDFWTFCCINCMHVIPDLAYLEQKYADELVVIGVHSAKFSNEKDSEKIRQAILRYEVKHPVVNDANFSIWNAYAVRAWPTLVLIDPEGYVANQYPGEGQRERIDRDIYEIIAEAKQKGTLKPSPLALALERAKTPDTPLSFPGKTLADAEGKRLFIADSNHNRIIVSRFDGTCTDVIGNGKVGATNGAYAEASFNHPQGMALDGDNLYVADTENHLVRRVNLKTKKVETVIGTGKLGYQRFLEGYGKELALNSPWDLAVAGRTLYIAMAGLHQIWQYGLDDDKVKWFAGSGLEGREDGLLVAAAFAQPSGLATDGKSLFVADSEISAIRAIDLKEARVMTLAGGDLFDFGDVDATGDAARFQHPLGVTYDGATLYVADTYNHKIKTLEPNVRTAKTFVGAGRSGASDGSSATFFEPGGISFANGKLYVADTNNHAVRVVNLADKTVSTLTLRKLPSVSEMTESKKDADEVLPNEEALTLPLQRIKIGSGEIVLNIKLPEGYHLNAETPHRYRIKAKSGEAVIIPPTHAEKTGPDVRFPVRVHFKAVREGQASIEALATLYYCRDGENGVCLIKSFRFTIPVEVRRRNTMRHISVAQTVAPAEGL